MNKILAKLKYTSTRAWIALPIEKTCKGFENKYPSADLRAENSRNRLILKIVWEIVQHISQLLWILRILLTNNAACRTLLVMFVKYVMYYRKFS